MITLLEIFILAFMLLACAGIAYQLVNTVREFRIGFSGHDRRGRSTDS